MFAVVPPSVELRSHVYSARGDFFRQALAHPGRFDSLCEVLEENSSSRCYNPITQTVERDGEIIMRSGDVNEDVLRGLKNRIQLEVYRKE